VNQLVRSALQSPDELLHMAVYNWLLSKKLTADLIAVQQPSLETYLLRTSELTQSSEIYDLLWKFYERNMNHAAAAKIQYKLAIRPGLVDTLVPFPPPACVCFVHLLLFLFLFLVLPAPFPVSFVLCVCFFVGSQFLVSLILMIFSTVKLSIAIFCEYFQHTEICLFMA
jgi:hypothetical protein